MEKWIWLDDQKMPTWAIGGQWCHFPKVRTPEEKDWWPDSAGLDGGPCRHPSAAIRWTTMYPLVLQGRTELEVEMGRHYCRVWSQILGEPGSCTERGWKGTGLIGRIGKRNSIQMRKKLGDCWPNNQEFQNQFMTGMWERTAQVCIVPLPFQRGHDLRQIVQRSQFPKL